MKKRNLGISAMASWVKPLPGRHPLWKQGQIPATKFLLQLPANVLGKSAEEGPSPWAPALTS